MSIPTTRNRLLARLPPVDQQRLLARMRPVTLEVRKPLYKAGSQIENVYFLNRGLASAMTVMEDGSAIEVATIGNDGMVGLGVLFAAKISPNEVIIQVPGDGLQMNAEDLEREAGPGSRTLKLLQQYNAVFQMQVSYSVACNGLHSIQQRCCRWLLTTHDRMDADEFPLTHEFLGIMLGVRRASVSDILGPLDDKGLISNTRGTITILDRRGLEKLACECYRKVKDEFDRLLN